MWIHGFFFIRMTSGMAGRRAVHVVRRAETSELRKRRQPRREREYRCARARVGPKPRSGLTYSLTFLSYFIT
jgi:hypothetical protein